LLILKFASAEVLGIVFISMELAVSEEEDDPLKLGLLISEV